MGSSGHLDEPEVEAAGPGPAQPPEPGPACPLPGADPDLLAELRRLQATLALERIARRDAVDRAERAYQLFAAIALIHQARGRAGVQEAVVEVASALLRCRDLALFRVDDEGGLLRPVHAVGALPGELARPRRIGEGLVGRAFGLRRIVVEATGVDDRADVAVPLSTERGAVGALMLLRLEASRVMPGHPDRDLLEILGRHAAAALELR